MLRLLRSLRRILPRSVLQFIALAALPVYQRHRQRPASRRCLEDELFPWLAARYTRILFVGTTSYLWHYALHFRRDQFTTIDRDPQTATWGSDDHITASIEEIARHRPEGFFDCVILNGIFGFGVDDVEHMRAVIEAVHSALRPHGLLIVGWNTDLHADPDALGLYNPYFTANQETPWVQRRHFPPETHVYDFYRRRPDQTTEPGMRIGGREWESNPLRTG